MVYPEVRLSLTTFQFTDDGCTTRFRDGSHIEALPNYDHHYYVISHRCGYGDDVMAYCREHDFCHNFLEERLWNRPSPILWALAHGGDVGGPASVQEEATAQMFQRWLRGGERPILGGMDWDRLKQDALLLLEAASAAA